MSRDKRLAEAKIIAERLSDNNAIWFHFMAINRLGFDKCYELASIALLARREGRINVTPARYYNGCVTKELRERIQQ